ncbi:MAG TPA: NYN domain-containing protein [Candidatus Limnocylindrales bacterium]|nr:NYN domain-containing protein [Candidatus Limnocylindrales bacterium]
MGKNVAVFVDVANIFYAAKAAGVDIDYVTLLKSATAGRDFVRAYAYTGLDPDNENQRNFHSFLARNSYKVVSKDIRKYGDGKVKANLDIELVVDLMKTARNLDVAIVVSGDGDFAPAIRAVQEMGVRVEVISFRGNTSSDLIEVADLFTDITQLARVEKGSSRSGRRVAGDEEDLSMTEVPDKQTEGTGAPRGRGRGRGRGRPGEAEPVAARARTAPIAARDNGVAASAGLTALPGEKLSKAAPPVEGDEEPIVEPVSVEPGPVPAEPVEGGEEFGLDADGRRRRRRRGGRGRGRGRGREQEPGSVPSAAGEIAPDLDDEAEDEEEEIAVAPSSAPRSPRTTPFGSVWDSQIGVPSTRPSSVSPLDEEDLDEPEIPEYLIAEQRRGQGGRGGGQGGRGGQPGRGGPRGGRGSYSAAIDRERYGRGGGGGINRYPDVSGRDRGGRSGGGGGGRPAEPNFARQDRPDRPERSDRPTGPRSSEPWSEVPEELEAMLRAQLAQSGKAAPRPAGRGESRSSGNETGALEPSAEAISPVSSTEPAVEAPPKRRTPTRRKPAASSEAEASPSPAVEAAEAAAPKRRTTRRKAGDDAAVAASTTDNGTAAAPKRRTTRTKSVATADEPTNGVATSETGETAAPKRRTTRKKAETGTV